MADQRDDLPEDDFDDRGRAGGGGNQLGGHAPAVASAPGKMFMVLILAVAGIGFVLWSLFSGGDKAPPPVEQVTEEVAALPSNPLPPPDLAQVTPPLPAPSITPEPPLPEPPVLPPIEPPSATAAMAPTDQARVQRLKSTMMVKDGGGIGGPGATQTQAQKALQSNDPNAAFRANVSAATVAEQQVATSVGNMYYTIAQGKFVNAVLETAINSDLPGSIRAIVSRDVFAEMGHLILIPKGSRLIGTYNSAILRGQQRVFIIWTRVIRPDGIDIMIDSDGTDQLGRAGLGGYVDNKYMEAYTGAFLTSLLSVGIAYGGEQLIGDEQVTTTQNTDGSSSTSGSAGSRALIEGAGNINDVTERVVDNLLDLRPTITVDQGTRVNVFVNRDLIFPSSVLSQTRVIQ